MKEDIMYWVILGMAMPLLGVLACTQPVDCPIKDRTEHVTCVKDGDVVTCDLEYTCDPIAYNLLPHD